MSDLRLQLILDTINKASAPLKAIDRDSSATANALKSSRDQLKNLQAQQRDVTSFQKLQGATRESAESLRLQQQRVAQLAKQLKTTESPTKALRQEFERATAKAKSLEAAHQGNRQKLHQLNTTLKNGGMHTANLDNRQEQLTAQIKQANGQIDAQKQKLAQLNEQQKRIQASRDRANNIRNNAMTLAGHGAVAAYGGQRALSGIGSLAQDGLSFDASMSRVQALTRLQKDSEAMQSLRAQARELGASTSFTSQDAAQGQGFLAMAGFTPDAIKDAMPGLLSLAKAAGEDLGATADISTNILSAFKMSADQMGQAGDVLTAAFTGSNTDLQMLGETMKYVGPVAVGLGGTLEEAAAMAGKLGNEGIQGGMAGTALRAIYSRLATAQGAAADAIADLGIETQDAMGNMRSMPELLAEISELTQDMGNAERAGILRSIAGEEAFSALQVLVNQAGNGELQAMITQLNNSQGAALKTASDMADNAVGDLDELESAWSDIKIELFETNNGPLRDTIQSITKTVQGIGSWIKENPKLAALLVKLSVILAVLVTAMGALALAVSAVMFGWAALLKLAPLLGLFKGLVAVLPLLSGGFATLGAVIAATPIGWILAAVAALVAVGVLIYKHWSSIRALFSGFWNGLSASLAPIIDKFGVLGDVLRWIGSGFSVLIGWFGSLMRPVDMAEEQLNRFSNAGEAAGKAIGYVFRGLLSPLTAVLDALSGIGQIWNRIFGARAELPTGTVLTTTGAMINEAASAPIQIDSRPPLQARAPATVSPMTVEGIHIHPTPGMDEQVLAKLVAREIQALQERQNAAARSHLRDED